MYTRTNIILNNFFFLLIFFRALNIILLSTLCSILNVTDSHDTSKLTVFELLTIRVYIIIGRLKNF